MSDLKLFKLEAGRASELVSTTVALERELQAVIEQNMPAMFTVRFLASEYSTGKIHRGRIDSLGLDENGSPDAQSLVDGATSVVGVVAVWAVRIGATLFFGWLVVDVFRMGQAHRTKGLRRAIRKTAGPRFAQLTRNAVVTNWLLALTSPAMVAVSLAAVTISLILSLRGVAG